MGQIQSSNDIPVQKEVPQSHRRNPSGNQDEQQTQKQQIKGAEQEEPEVFIALNGPIHKQLSILSNWNLSQLRQIYEKHQELDLPIDINKEEFRMLLGLEKQTSDYVFCKIAKLHRNLNSEREIDKFSKCKSQASFQQFNSSQQLLNGKLQKPKNPHNLSTLQILGTLIQENKIKKWNHDRVCIYEVLSGLAAVSYANFFQKIRFIYGLFDFDGNQAMDINELCIMTICFCAGWSRFTGIKMPQKKILENFGENIYSSAESVPDGKITVQDLGQWCEVNDEIMGMLSKFEPPLEVEEKDSTFLKFERNSYDFVQCSQKYLIKRAFQIQNEYDQNNKFKSMKQQLRRAPVINRESSSIIGNRFNVEALQSLKLPPIVKKVQKNILTVKGKTYKKSDIICFKKYFDSIDDDHTGQLTLDQYVRSISKSDHLRRIAVSLFNFLDKDQNGFLSFEEMLYKIIPGATKVHVNKMMSWVKEEEDITEKAVLNYKMPILQHKKTNHKLLNFQQMRDYIHVFVNIDNDLDGLITADNFKKCFSTVMSSKQINDLFWDNLVQENRLMNIEEFLEVVKPKECDLNRDVLKTQVQEYLHQLISEKRSDLVDKGLWATAKVVVHQRDDVSTISQSQ